MTDNQQASWDSMKAQLVPGDLLVAREASAALVASAEAPAQEEMFDRLLALCAAPGHGGTGSHGAALVRQAAALAATARAEEVPAFGIVTPDDHGFLVMVCGPLRVRVLAQDGSVVELDGADSVLPVTRVVRQAPAMIAIGRDPGGAQPDPRTHLSSGVVRAGGLVLEPRIEPLSDEAPTMLDLKPVPPPASVPDPPAEPEAEPTPEPEPEPEPTFTTFSLTEDDDSDEQPAVDLPPDPVHEHEAAETPAPSAPSAPRALVRGIVCTRGHFNAPDARFCATCGVSMVQQTHHLVTGERPPLGVLVAEDGSRFALLGDYVIGRDPDSSETVRSGRAEAIVLDDPELSVSRVHALLVLDEWEVTVEDAGSANGTFLADEGSEDWRLLAPGAATTIRPGTRVRLGSRVLTYESHNKA